MTDVTVTSDVVTRVVEANLGSSYRAYRVTARTGGSLLDTLVPHRLRALLRRDGSGWVVTQVIVIGRAELPLARYEADVRVRGRTNHGDYSHAPSPPPERQRTFADLTTAPAWVGDVARALLAAVHEEDP